MVRLFRFLFVCGVPEIAGCIVVGITIWHFDRHLPNYQRLAYYQPAIMTSVYAR
jgi:membrane carboxypeptidase/penicillin-binding protein